MTIRTLSCDFFGIMRTFLRNIVGLLATTSLSACGCTGHQRIDLPTGHAYGEAIARVQRLAGTITIHVTPFRLQAHSSEGRVFARLGYVRYVNGRAIPIGDWKQSAPNSERSDPHFVIDVPIGRQQVDALTFASTDNSACVSYGVARDDIGYRAHVDRLNALGAALLSARALSIGVDGSARLWDGRLHENGVLSTSVDQADEAHPRVFEHGEIVGRSSSFQRTDRALGI